MVLSRDENIWNVESSCVSVDLKKTDLSESEKTKFKEFMEDFSGVFFDKLGLTHVTWH